VVILLLVRVKVLGRFRAGLVSGVWVLLLFVAVFGVVLKLPLVKCNGGTIYIRADGSVDPPTAPITSADNVTYIFTDNISDSVMIERNNIIVDGNGYTLQGSGNGYGFNLTGICGVTIKNTNVREFPNGVYLNYSSNNNIIENNITNNGAGISLGYSSNNNISGNNITANNGQGVRLESSSNNSIVGNNIANNSWCEGIGLLYGANNNSIVGNNITNNGEGIGLTSSLDNQIIGNNVTANDVYGVCLFDAPNTMFRNNSIADNGFNFGITPSGYLSEYVQDLDESNTVDNKPIYYWVNRQNMRVPSNAGFVALANSYNITVEGLKLSKNGRGILLYNTTNSQVTNNNITANEYDGVRLESSSNNSISGNNITNNDVGIDLAFSSNNNTIVGNEINANNWCGVRLPFSSYNNVIGNNIANSSYGVSLYFSSNNEFHWNNFVDNSVQVDTYAIGTNVWDDGYPSGGNYWSSYTGVDSFTGFYQNETGSDRIGDTPYVIDVDNQDHYPLMSPFVLGCPRTCFNYLPEFPPAGETVTFDASTSYAYQGFIMSYTWNFGDGNTTTVAYPIITHVFATDGVYPVNLTVTDNDGLSRSITRSIAVGVDSTPPTIGIPSRMPEGDVLPDQSVKVSVNVTDIVSQVKNVTLSYTINEGASWTDLPMDPNPSTNVYEATIPPQEVGTWVRFKITAYDHAGNTATLDGTEPYCVYKVIPEFSSNLILPMLTLITFIATILQKKKRKTKPQLP
jgi:parallel beta-helix repeat protein